LISSCLWCHSIKQYRVGKSSSKGATIHCIYTNSQNKNPLCIGALGAPVV
jgi:hypothetical protein